MSHLFINSSLHSPRQHSAPELGGGGGWRGQDDAGEGQPGQLARVGQDHPGADAEGEKQQLGWEWAAGLREAELSQQGVPDRQGGARRGEYLDPFVTSC